MYWKIHTIVKNIIAYYLSVFYPSLIHTLSIISGLLSHILWSAVMCVQRTIIYTKITTNYLWHLCTPKTTHFFQIFCKQFNYTLISIINFLYNLFSDFKARQKTNEAQRKTVTIYIHFLSKTFLFKKHNIIKLFWLTYTYNS